MTTDPLQTALSRGRTLAIAVSLLAVFAAAAVGSLIGDAATFDETAHVAAGFTYVDAGDFRLNPEHPPLSKLWAALPLLAVDAAVADYDSTYWTGRPIADRSGRRSKADEWLFGYEFLNGPLDEAIRKDPRDLLLPARTAMVLPGLLLGWIVFVWSRELWGDVGALLSVTLYALSPTMLAHTRLVTTDLPSALGFTLALYAFWRFCRRPGSRRLAWFALALVPALLIKFSSLLLGPMLVVAGIGWVVWPGIDSRDRRSRLRWLVGAGAAALVASYAGIWAGYGFRFEAATDPAYELNWAVVGLKEGALAGIVHRAVETRLLPEAYLYGFAYFAGGAARRLSFLNGEQSLTGWWYYFPQAFLMKTTPALLVLLGWLGIESWRGGRWRSWNGWYLLAPGLLYVVISMASNLNIGHRHLTPLYPLLFVLLGGLTQIVGGSRLRRLALFGLLALHLVSFAVATPRYLSYFNFSAGGAAGGWRYLLDSNIDWGQDLARLGLWMERRHVDEVYLAYFGTADPSAYGIRYRKVYRVHDFAPGRPMELPRSGDHLAVSVNLLQGLYYDEDRATAEELLRRGWIDSLAVQRWLELRDRRVSRGADHPALGPWLVEQELLSGLQLEQIERGLVSRWLASIRDRLEPVGRAGDSILIYRLP